MEVFNHTSSSAKSNQTGCAPYQNHLYNNLIIILNLCVCSGERAPRRTILIQKQGKQIDVAISIDHHHQNSKILGENLQIDHPQALLGTRKERQTIGGVKEKSPRILNHLPHQIAFLGSGIRSYRMLSHLCKTRKID